MFEENLIEEAEAREARLHGAYEDDVDAEFTHVVNTAGFQVWFSPALAVVVVSARLVGVKWGASTHVASTVLGHGATSATALEWALSERDRERRKKLVDSANWCLLSMAPHLLSSKTDLDDWDLERELGLREWPDWLFDDEAVKLKQSPERVQECIRKYRQKAREHAERLKELEALPKGEMFSESGSGGAG